MKYMLFALLALFVLGACSNTQEIPEDNSGNDDLPSYAQGTHMICENGDCRYENGCPAGYDEFMAQMGPACVKHYGVEEIDAWQTCSRSTQDCDCVMATRTTDGAQIKQSEENAFRCAPEGYGNYLIHFGKTGLDENGDQYTAIA
jgi:hypothetical protein